MSKISIGDFILKVNDKVGREIAAEYVDYISVTGHTAEIGDKGGLKIVETKIGIQTTARVNAGEYRFMEYSTLLLNSKKLKSKYRPIAMTSENVNRLVNLLFNWNILLQEENTQDYKAPVEDSEMVARYRRDMVDVINKAISTDEFKKELEEEEGIYNLVCDNYYPIYGQFANTYGVSSDNSFQTELQTLIKNLINFHYYASYIFKGQSYAVDMNLRDLYVDFLLQNLSTLSPIDMEVVVSYHCLCKEETYHNLVAEMDKDIYDTSEKINDAVSAAVFKEGRSLLEPIDAVRLELLHNLTEERFQSLLNVLDAITAELNGYNLPVPFVSDINISYLNMGDRTAQDNYRNNNGCVCITYLHSLDLKVSSVLVPKMKEEDAELSIMMEAIFRTIKAFIDKRDGYLVPINGEIDPLQYVDPKYKFYCGFLLEELKDLDANDIVYMFIASDSEDTIEVEIGYLSDNYM